MEEQKIIHLNKYNPRPYQLPILDAIENKGYKRVLSILPRRCISGRAHIIMADGSYRRMKDIQPGDHILAWNGSRFVADTVAEVWPTGNKSAVMSQSKNCLPLVTSPDHLFLTDQEKQVWLKAEDIKSNRVFQYSGIQGEVHDPDVAELYGYLVAIPPVAQRTQIKISHQSRDMLERIEYLVDAMISYLPFNPIWRENRGLFSIVYPTPTRRLLNVFLSCVRRNDKECGFVPARVFLFDNVSLDRFLGAYCTIHGKIFDDKGTFSLAVTINGKESFANVIYWLFRKRGVLPSPPTLGDDNHWRIYISDPTVIKNLFTHTSFGEKHDKGSRLTKFLSLIKDGSITQDSYESFAVAQKTYESEEMYDLRTERYGNFVANGYVVHNSGKDITAFNLAIRQCLRRPCVVYYIFPTYAQGKKILWDSITNDGMRILDYIPEELVESKNSQEMKIRFINGSLFQIVGSDNYDSLVGTNPQGVVFSEYALQDPRAYQFIRPILTANDGWALFISTPRGKNHLYDLYNIAQQSPLWFAQKLTVEDTKHIPIELIDQERAEGIMSEDLIQQEYYTSFTMGVEGSYYAKYLDKMRLNNHIGTIPWTPGHKVHTAWDLGVRDSTTIIFFQTIGATVHMVDCYENTKEGLEHYVKVVKDKPYVYGRHIAPHDIRVKEFGSGITRIDKARQLGINFTIAPDVSIADGIEAVRSALGGKIFIDEVRCAKLLKALENYRQEYDAKRKVYRDHPLHDWSSNFADAMRYLCISLPKTRDGLSPEDLEKRYNEAVYGDSNDLPHVFR